ncbi:MAG: alginate lyase family protein [Deltaproteobacteria bacterium]|nr:alginate lyase family protein [Deltaproteobacteria bacterium]
MEAWRTSHTDGVGWAPFPISLRAFAWGKLLATPGALASGHEVYAASLADQLATLSDRQETHILANHYLWNLLALVFGGVLLEGAEADRWCGLADRLVAELGEQVPADGAHFERSPSYHALLLENLLDLLNISESREGRLPGAALRSLCEVAERMLGALAFYTLPDGEIALFGDSAFEIASVPASLQAYGETLGLTRRAPEPAGRLMQAGFARLDVDPFTLIVSASPPAPSFQPGHAHCDALHFELCVGNERVITDTGVCEYVPGERRDAARTTGSHATVEIEGHEQAELWAAHRIGGRPDVAIPRYDAAGGIEAVCAGWNTPEILHTRCFELDANGLTILDRFDRRPREACFHLPLGPGLEPDLKDGIARIPLASGRTLEILLPEGLEFRVERGPYFPRFGSAEERAFLRGTGHDLAEARTSFRLV